MSLSPVKRSSRPARPLSVVDSPTSSRGRDLATTPTESDRSRFGFRRNSLEPNHIPDLNGGIQRRFSLTPSAMKKPFNRHSVALDHPNLSSEIIMDNSPTRTYVNFKGDRWTVLMLMNVLVLVRPCPWREWVNVGDRRPESRPD